MYGIDWEGPVSVPEEDTVTVEEMEDVLSTVQKEELSSLLSPISNNVFSQQEMLGQFAIAKSFVQQFATIQ